MTTSAIATRTAVMPHPGSIPISPRMRASLTRVPTGSSRVRELEGASLAMHAAPRRPPCAGPASLPPLFRRHHRRPVRVVDADRHAVLARAPAYELVAPSGASLLAPVRAAPAS